MSAEVPGGSTRADDVIFADDKIKMDEEDSKQRLKAAVHYSVRQICRSVGEEKNVDFDQIFVASLSEVLNKQIASFSTDLELFASHAKRSTVNIDDVKLLVRKTPDLLNLVENVSTTRAADREATRKPSKKTAT